ncbi:hypothetical protein PsorP6_016674 [Peronosclerospora sorghi]|uniref:Uncharacterized protein n=1 Tax=Peronosclerospora sorghi TaxID=230839 RepID=A0ACC0VMD8_9STRA|nr:hypothetical protein PsorP6_016674 [Peronosclerospora sorghi]
MLAILRGTRAVESAYVNSMSTSSTSKSFVNTVIHTSAKIGKGCYIGPFSSVGEGVSIGNDTTIGANVTLQNCTIGSKVVIHPGTRIGQDGFGIILDASGDHAKKSQELSVEIHDDVEIGYLSSSVTRLQLNISYDAFDGVDCSANCAIDRGSWRNTVIGKGCKLDNLVRRIYFTEIPDAFNTLLCTWDQIQIGHNVQLGTGCVIAAQTGIAGSTTLGKNVHIGGQVGVAQHLKIGDNVRIAAKSGVMNHLESNATYGMLIVV